MNLNLPNGAFVPLFFICLLLSVGAWTLFLLGVTSTPFSALTQPQELDIRLQAGYVIGLYTALCFWLILFQKKQDLSWSDIGFNAKKWLESGIQGFCLGIGLLIGHYLFLFLLNFLQIQTFSLSLKSIILLLCQNLCIAVAFAMIEEWLFRGWLLKTLLKSRSQGFSLILQALIYACVHQQAGILTHPQFYGLCLAGALLGAIALNKNSLWPGIGFHASWIFLPLTLRDLNFIQSFEKEVNLHGGLMPLEGWIGVGLIGLGSAFYYQKIKQIQSSEELKKDT